MKKLALSLSVLCFAVPAFAATPVDLSTWSEVTLDFPGGQSAANWAVQPGNTVVRQTLNSDPSFFLNNVNQTAFSIDGTWRVTTTGDDDFMGFVFGYQNSANFYLFDWKQVNQVNAGATATEGMTIKQYTGGTTDGLTSLSIAEFWENTSNLGDMEVLAQNHGSTKGWADNTTYDFHLDFNTTGGEFRIVVKDGATVLWDQTVVDSTFTGGQFGFYNNSQESVQYAGFTQTGGTPVNAPDGGATGLLMALGVGTLGWFSRRVRR